MSRLKQTQNIDSLIDNLQTVVENQCSLSEDDLIVINDSLNILKDLRRKKGKTNEQILDQVVRVVELLTKLFS